MDFTVPVGHSGGGCKKTKRHVYSELAAELEKAVKHKDDTNHTQCARNSTQKLGEETGRIGNQT